jgi:hypothetical protein
VAFELLCALSLKGASAELRELSAEGLGELVEVTGEDSLKPYVVQITGPLIRIIGDKFPWQVCGGVGEGGLLGGVRIVLGYPFS